jgi:Glyoxalase-like domain
MTCHLLALCFDANDPLRLARFWAGVLGWEIADDPLGPPLTPKTGKYRLHFDLAPPLYGDQQAEVDRLVSLGAMRIDIGQGEASWVVMADPDGHEFCVHDAEERE